MILGVAEEQSNPAEAERIYRRGLAIYPTDGPLNSNVGNLLFKQQRYAESIPFLQAAFLKSDPNRPNPRLLNNLGSALLNTGHVNEAIDAFKFVVEKFPDHLNAHINLGHAYLMIGRLDLAEPPLQRALQIDPSSAAAQRWMNVLRDGKAKTLPP